MISLVEMTAAGAFWHHLTIIPYQHSIDLRLRLLILLILRLLILNLILIVVVIIIINYHRCRPRRSPPPPPHHHHHQYIVLYLFIYCSSHVRMYYICANINIYIYTFTHAYTAYIFSARFSRWPIPGAFAALCRSLVGRLDQSCQRRRARIAQLGRSDLRSDGSDGSQRWAAGVCDVIGKP